MHDVGMTHGSIALKHWIWRYEKGAPIVRFVDFDRTYYRKEKGDDPKGEQKWLSRCERRMNSARKLLGMAPVYGESGLRAQGIEEVSKIPSIPETQQGQSDGAPQVDPDKEDVQDSKVGTIDDNVIGQESVIVQDQQVKEGEDRCKDLLEQGDEEIEKTWGNISGRTDDRDGREETDNPTHAKKQKVQCEEAIDGHKMKTMDGPEARNRPDESEVSIHVKEHEDDREQAEEQGVGSTNSPEDRARPEGSEAPTNVNEQAVQYGQMVQEHEMQEMSSKGEREREQKTIEDMETEIYEIDILLDVAVQQVLGVS